MEEGSGKLEPRWRAYEYEAGGTPSSSKKSGPFHPSLPKVLVTRIAEIERLTSYYSVAGRL